MSNEENIDVVDIVSEELFMSNEIGKLAEALAKAQGAMGHASKNKENPFFNSDYSDLASCWDTCREPLSQNGLAVVQTHKDPQTPGNLALVTHLIHSSGQWIKGVLEVRPVKNDPQMAVSATTYTRRAGLMAIVGISPSDDDGNASSGKILESKSKPVRKSTKDKKTKTKEPEQNVDSSNDEDEF